MSFVGAGIGYRRTHRDALLADAGERPALLEIIPGHFFGEPEALAPLAARYPLVFHEVGLSLGTADAGSAASRALVARIRALIDLARPALVTDHVAITRSPGGVDLGHLCPLWYTREALALVGDRVRALQDRFGVPVALENIAAPFALGEAELTEAAFFGELCAATGCGMLLDLSNLIANARNFGFDAAARLADYPLEAVVQVHLAGGSDDRGFWVDSHDAPVGDDAFALLAQLRGRARSLVAIVVERDDRVPPLPELVAEARRAEALWRPPWI
ncbi:MAG TPA: DUF692 domain-containing protein [Kofleriaceae bacterium]|nr:DUF692 domain-containing protein [Kofleriaceae bacterium]